MQSPPRGATIPYRPKPQVTGPVILANGQAFTIQGNYAVPTQEVGGPPRRIRTPSTRLNVLLRSVNSVVYSIASHCSYLFRSVSTLTDPPLVQLNHLVSISAPD